MAGTWVFGYGSLVDPSSFGETIGRSLRPGVDFFAAEVGGFGRRWNYGVMHGTGFAVRHDGSSREYTRIALGVVESPEEVVNGVVGWVDDQGLRALDRRERHYDRVEVRAWTVAGGGVAGPVVLYQPRQEAIDHYEQARDRGMAAIEQRYWDLVDRAFAAFGPDAHARYHATTPAPDVPVLELTPD